MLKGRNFFPARMRSIADDVKGWWRESATTCQMKLHIGRQLRFLGFQNIFEGETFPWTSTRVGDFPELELLSLCPTDLKQRLFTSLWWHHCDAGAASAAANGSWATRNRPLPRSTPSCTGGWKHGTPPTDTCEWGTTPHPYSPVCVRGKFGWVCARQSLLKLKRNTFEFEHVLFYSDDLQCSEIDFCWFSGHLSKKNYCCRLLFQRVFNFYRRGRRPWFCGEDNADRRYRGGEDPEDHCGQRGEIDVASGGARSVQRREVWNKQVRVLGPQWTSGAEALHVSGATLQLWLFRLFFQSGPESPHRQRDRETDGGLPGLRGGSSTVCRQDWLQEVSLVIPHQGCCAGDLFRNPLCIQQQLRG